MSIDDRVGSPTAGKRAHALLDVVARAGRETRVRIAAAIEELFQAREPGLNDLERSLSLRMLHGLMTAIETDLRARMFDYPALPIDPEFRESLASDRVAIAMPLLEQAGLLRDTELVALLLRRVDEYRLGGSLRARREPITGRALDALVADPDSAVASAAMALLIAESRRNDRFDDPALAPADLPAELLHRLTWQVAASVRAYAVAEHDLDPAALDPILAACADAILAGHDEGERLEAAALRLARLLESSSALPDGLLVDALSRGRLIFYAAALAARAGVAPEAAWDAVMGADQTGHAVLLRATDADDDTLATLLLAMIDARGTDETGESVAHLVDTMRGLDDDVARAAVGPWRLDAIYRVTLDRLADRRLKLAR